MKTHGFIFSIMVYFLFFASQGLAQNNEDAVLQDGGGGEAAEQAEPTLEKPPRLKQLISAVLPPGTEFPSPQVQVVLEIDVDQTGAVEEVRVSQGAGEPFDTAALNAARQFSFEPALLSNGETAPVTITFRMRIQEPPPPPPPPVNYEGTLLERGTRTPLADVEVSASKVLDDGQPGELLTRSQTDELGRFSLTVPQDRFVLSAQPAGHQTLNELVAAQPGESRQELFYLESVGNPFETLVTATRARREVVKQVISKEVVDRLPGTQGDTLKVVQNLPGAARAPFLGGQLILRGASPGDSRIFLEGHEIPILYHFGALRSTVNSAFLEAVEYIPGNFGPEYGRAMGGVVQVKVRDPKREGIHGQVDLNLYDAGFMVEGPVSENWSLGGAFHRSWIDSILPLVLPDDAPLSFNTAPRYYDYQILATWKPDPNRRTRIMAFGSMDKLELLFKRPQSDPAIRGSLRGRIMFHNLQASHRHRLSPKLSQETSFQIGYQEIDTVIGPELFFNLGVVGFSFRTSWEYQALDWLAVEAGLDMRVDDVEIELNSPLRAIEGENQAPVSSGQVFGYRGQTTLYQPAGFLGLRFEPLKGLAILPSLRMDYYRDIDRLTLDPRLMVQYQPIAGTIIRGGIGYFHQPPTADQAVAELGNPNLFAPRSSHSSLAVEQRVMEGLTIEASGFYKWLDRQVVRNPDFFANPEAPPYESLGTGRIYGLELLVKAQLEDFNGWLAYTWQRSFRKDGPESDERRFDFDQPHILTLVGRYDIGWGFSAGLRFRLVSGNPETPVLGAIYDAVADVWVPQYGKTNSSRLPLFHQLDVRLDKDFVFDLWKLKLYLEVVNVYNQDNPEGYQYSYDYSQRSRLTGLPILPILGVQGEW